MEVEVDDCVKTLLSDEDKGARIMLTGDGVKLQVLRAAAENPFHGAKQC